MYEDAKRHVLEMAHNCHPPLPDAEAVGCLNSAKKGRDKEDPIVTELNAYLAKIMAGSSCCILWEEKDPVTGQVTAIHLYKPEDLRVWFSDRVVTVVKMGRERDINILDYWLKHTKHRKYVKLAFAPGQKLPDDVYNLWQGPAVKPNANGSCQLFLDHILENIADGSHEKNDYLLNWMADAVQNPTERPGVANVLQGDQGVGKSVFADQFGKLFGHYYVQINSSRELTGNFNAHLEGKLLVFYDEASCTGDRQVAAKLRAMITEETLPIERKGRDMFYVDNYIRLILASNDDAVIPAGAEERRYFATHVGKKHQGDRSYFKAIIDQMETGGREHLMHLLLNRDLTGIDLGVFPKTVTLFENKLANMEPVFKWWYEKLVSPADEWQSVVGKDCLYQSYLSYCNHTGERQRLDKSTFGKKLKKLLPSVNESRETEQERKLRLQKGGSNLTRKWQYVFPSQRECRCSFEAWVKQSIEWDAD